MRLCNGAADGPILRLDDVHTYYGAIHALKGVSIEVRRGEVVTLIGANGAGKSTTLRSINGLNHPRQGSIRFEGRDITHAPPHEVVRLGIAQSPEGRRLFPSLTVDEHLKIAARNGSGERSWTKERVYDLFPRLAERKRNGGAELSGGEQQMLAIGRALLGNPALLIMDEPSEGLAPTVVDTLVETMKKLEEEGLAILLIEQKLDVATSVATRQLVMVGGEIALETTASQLASDAEMQRRYLGVEPVAR